MQTDALQKLSQELPYGLRAKAAKVCGVTPTAISRMLSGKIKSRKAKEVLIYLLDETEKEKRLQKMEDANLALRVQCL